MRSVAEALARQSRLEPALQKSWVRFAVLAVIVVALEVIMFRSYFRGQEIPPWDFLGSYNTDAYLWWADGGFFTPLDWIPNVWAGYPSALNLQNSAWYLPVGVASLFGPFTLHSSAIVAALNVALGFAGTYLLVRSFRHSFAVSTVLAVASFFGVAYFSNAQHVDIARGYALIPWILLVLSPTWGWKRPWGIPVAVLVLWQGVTGMYPGMVVTTVYVGIIWIVFYQLQSRAKLRDYLLPLGVATLGAVLLSAPRLVPYFLTQEGGVPPWPDGSAFSPAMVGTLLFGYSSGDLPNDVSMRSFFIPATALLLAFFARYRDATTKQALAIGISAALLGLPFFPWFTAVQSLPGIGLSRFTMSDFKVFMILAVLLLAASGLTALSRLERGQPIPSRVWWSIASAAVFCALMGVVGIVGPFTRVEWFPPMVVLGLAFLTIAAFILLCRRALLPFPVLAGALVLLTVASGMVWAFTTSVTWKAPRVDAEIAAYGASVDDLLDERSDEQGDESGLTQRPERLEPAAGYDLQDLRDVEWNRVYYTGDYSVGGYLNLKGTLTPEQLEVALLDEDRGDAVMDFLAASGRVITSAGDAEISARALEACATSGECGDAELTPAGYSPGHLQYQVSGDEPVSALFNESYYRGWSAAACHSDGQCDEVEVSRSSLGLLQADLPEGDYKLVVDYQTPGRLSGWVLFGLGIVIAIASSITVSWGLRRQRKQGM